MVPRVTTEDEQMEILLGTFSWAKIPRVVNLLCSHPTVQNTVHGSNLSARKLGDAVVCVLKRKHIIEPGIVFAAGGHIKDGKKGISRVADFHGYSWSSI